MASSQETALQTIDALEMRLRRLEFMTLRPPFLDDNRSNGAGDTESNEQNVLDRLVGLENQLARLASRSQVVEDILRLHSRYPDLFDPPDTTMQGITISKEASLAVVLASATLFPETASRLTSLQDSPIPPAETSVSLVSLLPQIAALEVQQEKFTREIMELRRRSAAVLERWYESQILAGGECWAEWDSRISQVYRVVRRHERTSAEKAEI